MPSETRADLMAKLLEMGEVPPAHWTVMQIKARLAELRASMAENQTITLKQRLNKAAKKKANLVQVGRGSSPPHHGQHHHCPDLCDG